MNIISAEPVRCHYQTVGTMRIMSPRPEDTMVIQQCNISNNKYENFNTHSPSGAKYRAVTVILSTIPQCWKYL